MFVKNFKANSSAALSLKQCSLLGSACLLSLYILLVVFFTQREMVSLDRRATELFPKTALSFLVRDGEAYLERNLGDVEEKILSRCADWRVYYVENNSRDSTRLILNQFSHKHNGRIFGNSLELQTKTSTQLCAGEESNCRARVAFLGDLRSTLLKEALTWEEAVLYVVLDLDFVSFDGYEFWNMYTNVMLPYDADGVFGVSAFSRYTDRKFCVTQPYGCAIYDYGAILPPVVLDLVMGTNNTIIPVRSAFSGFGMYRVASIRSNRASYTHPRVQEILASMGDDPERRRRWGMMEHIHLNLHLQNLLLYTVFKPEYGN